MLLFVKKTYFNPIKNHNKTINKLELIFHKFKLTFLLLFIIIQLIFVKILDLLFIKYYINLDSEIDYRF
jgi:hypothetical protein